MVNTSKQQHKSPETRPPPPIHPPTHPDLYNPPGGPVAVHDNVESSTVYSLTFDFFRNFQYEMDMEYSMRDPPTLLGGGSGWVGGWVTWFSGSPKMSPCPPPPQWLSKGLSPTQREGRKGACCRVSNDDGEHQ